MANFNPILKTPFEKFNEQEKQKRVFYERYGQAHYGSLKEDLNDLTTDHLFSENDAIIKSHGIYVQNTRAKSGEENDWRYMMRVTIPGGGPLNLEQWRILDEIAEQYSFSDEQAPSLRLTTRQNIQFHWVKKEDLIPATKKIAQSGFYTLNGCGDNTRNVMACPLSLHSNLFDANAMAQKAGKYFRLDMAPHIHIFEIDTSYRRTSDSNAPAESTEDGHFQYGPQLLNRKFKIAFSAIHIHEETGEPIPDNCVEILNNDMGVAPIYENGKISAYQVYIGGGQGEKNGKATMSSLAQPLGVFTKENLIAGLDAVVAIHQEWGDRCNRHWARIKYTLKVQGMEWFQQELRHCGIAFDPPRPDLNIGDRHLHHGWTRQPTNGLWSYGAHIPTGRIVNDGYGRLKEMIPALLRRYNAQIVITPNQDLLFINIAASEKLDFERSLEEYGYGYYNGVPFSSLRRHSVACVGLPTCPLTYTDSERFLPELIDQLDAMNWGYLKESIGVSGCERQCSRPATKVIGWIGSGRDRYALKLFGTEDARHQGGYLMEGETQYLRSVPRENVAKVTAALFSLYEAERLNPSESMGYTFRRLGLERIVAYLQIHPDAAPWMKPLKNANVLV
ncbi:MAG: nitrite/sulfite reductase [Candidatus Omnitrophota bacterium]